MRRRSRAGDEPIKKRHRKSVTLKRSNAPKDARRGSSGAGLQEQLDRRTRELNKALEQQTATAEILRVIRTSPADVQPVFETIVRNAVSLCGSLYAHVFRFDGELLHVVASHNVAPSPWRHYADFLKAKYPMRPDSSQVSGRVLLKKSVVRLEDARADPDYDQRSARGGWRRVLGVPMLREGEPLGVIVVGWTEAGPVPKVQEELLKTFADQAVIAIENTRLLNELRESLEQQTATSEVLKVISSSQGELEPVFDAMLANATRVCEASHGALWVCEGDGFRNVALHGALPASYAAKLRRMGNFRPHPEAPIARAARIRETVHTADLGAEQAYIDRDPLAVAAVELAGIRTVVVVPMLKEQELVGVIVIYRREVRPFTNKQIALVQNFAAQAVIAIENARLFEAEQQRTRELSESLEQQTATSEVLRVISSSPSELAPVFQTMLANATRLCDATFGVLLLYEGDWRFRVVAMSNVPLVFAELRQREPVFEVSQQTGLGRAIATGDVVHIADYAEEPIYKERRHPSAVALGELGGARTYLVVPMLKDKKIAGAIAIYRQQVRPFTDKQIELVRSFASQAVIAIENTRLLNELRQRTADLSESLEQQTATSEVLQVISSSPGNLQRVFDAMLASATRLCDASYGTMWLREGAGQMRVAARHGNLPEAFDEQWRVGRLFRPSPSVPTARVFVTHKLLHVVDLKEDRSYLDRDPLAVASVELAGIRTLVSAPMLKGDAVVGTLNVYRREVRPFTDKQIAVVQNFAAQAVIAIENTRLLNELRESLQQQTATADVLKVISRSTFDLTMVLDTLVNSAARLCRAEKANIALLREDIVDYVAQVGFPSDFLKYMQSLRLKVQRGSVSGRAALEGRIIHVPDVLADPEFVLLDAQKVGGFRTALGVPLMREGTPIGTMFLSRATVEPFTEQQIELVSTFADQAVIAIENTRLLDELRQSLQQQTATADVLKIISRSTFDLKTVLNTLVESAARLCDADMASVPRVTGGILDFFASYGYSPGFHEFLRNHPTSPGRGTVSGRAVLESRTVHIPDVLADPEYDYGEGQKIGGYRTLLGVPLMREGAAVGALLLGRAAPRPFTSQQIELLETFADQAVIAIENVRLFDEIQEKSRQLEIASQHKSQFLANMSHELRTPLNAILGYAELMTDGAYGEPSDKMLEVLKRLEANGKHLLGLINDVLDLSKIEAGQLVLELTDYCIQDIAQTVRSTLEPLAADKRLAFKVEMAPELPPGHGDGRRLTQVLINLVGNAIKFTDAGEVAIKAEANNGAFHVSVRDTGPGISAVDQARLFQEFQQADNAITKKKGGTGLGLAISKRIIDMHGGKIWVESQPGQGSTFTFTLPVIVERQVEAA
jgi:GAF domain-containing protein/anti-sigma regulatory factor (Ser/Thr protein kinase)